MAKWTVMRDYYATLLDQAQRDGITQKVIAARGGLSGANLISKLLVNDHLGPSVEVFLRAILGLGMQPSAFFAAIEARVGAASTSPPESPHVVAPAVSPAALDRDRTTLAAFHADIARTVEILRQHLDLVAAQHEHSALLADLAARVTSSRAVPPSAPRVRAAPRRRARRVA